MMTFIWDLDGTLLDTYPIIMKSLNETFCYFDIPYEYDEVKKGILDQSVVNVLKQTSRDFSIPYGELKSFFSEKTRSKNNQVILKEGAVDVLEWTRDKKITNFIYTHKSDNALKILDQLNVGEYFSEVITSSNGFQRKPDSEALDYLIVKYQLKRENTYYIGDRILDVDVAVNANIKSINLTQPSSEFNVNISKLTDICDKQSLFINNERAL